MKRVEVRLFGSFRRYQGDGTPVVRLDIPDDGCVAHVRAELGRVLRARSASFLVDGGAGLIAESAFADEVRVLAESDSVGDGAHLAILPPVCGG